MEELPDFNFISSTISLLAFAFEGFFTGFSFFAVTSEIVFLTVSFFAVTFGVVFLTVSFFVVAFDLVLVLFLTSTSFSEVFFAIW